MEQKSTDQSAESEFVFNPINKVVGIIDDADDVKAALRDLKAAGFPAGEIEVLAGEEGARLINAAGGEREASVHTVHPNRRPFGHYDAPGLLKHVEQQLLAGHFSVGVLAEKESARERVHRILKSHHGHFINFCGTWAVEALEP